MSKDVLVWSDVDGDVRGKKKSGAPEADVVESELVLNIRRLTSGKGRTVIEITNLPHNTKWCKQLAKEIKKFLGAGGTYKQDVIEIHGEQMDKIMHFFEKRNLTYKKTGG